MFNKIKVDKAVKEFDEGKELVSSIGRLGGSREDYLEASERINKRGKR